MIGTEAGRGGGWDLSLPQLLPAVACISETACLPTHCPSAYTVGPPRPTPAVTLPTMVGYGIETSAPAPGGPANTSLGPLPPVVAGAASGDVLQ